MVALALLSGSAAGGGEEQAGKPAAARAENRKRRREDFMALHRIRRGTAGTFLPAARSWEAKKLRL
jgi:hypothetical protein